MNLSTLPWLFPAIFMTHEFEEIIFVGAWKKRNASYIKSHGKKLLPYVDFISTSSFSLAVAKEWLLLFIVTGAAAYFQNYFIWYGLLFGFTLHLVVLHILLGSLFR